MSEHCPSCDAVISVPHHPRCPRHPQHALEQIAILERENAALRAKLAAARAEGMEEAARICDDIAAQGGDGNCAERCACAIRMPIYRAAKERP